MLWRLCQPSDAALPGLGMTWQQAKRLNPTIAYFLLSSETDAKAISKRFRMRYLKASGVVPADRESLRKAAKEHMAKLREYYTRGE